MKSSTPRITLRKVSRDRRWSRAPSASGSRLVAWLAACAVAWAATPASAQWFQVRNNDGSGSPKAPGTIYLGDTNLTFAGDAWGNLGGQWGGVTIYIHTGSDVHNGKPGTAITYNSSDGKTNTSAQFTSTGTWYWGMRVQYNTGATVVGWYCRNSSGWHNAWGTPSSDLSLTVNPLTNATGATATMNTTYYTNQIDLTWYKPYWDVMVTRTPVGSTITDPTGGTRYNAGDTIGTATKVLYRGALTSTNITDCQSESNYYFKLYSENWNYYSPGVVVTGRTAGAEPASSPNTLSFSAITTTAMRVSWANVVTQALVVGRANADLSGDPADLSQYAANAALGSGTALGSGYVVYRGNGTYVDVTGLTNNGTYYWRVYNFRGSGGAENYRTSDELSGNQATMAAEPATQARTVIFSGKTNYAMTVGWTSGSGANRLVVARLGAAPSAAPVDGTTYSANVAYGSGTALGGGYVVYNGSGSSVAGVTNLTAGGNYFFQVFEYNGSGSLINYNTSADTLNPSNSHALCLSPMPTVQDGLSSNNCYISWSAATNAYTTGAGSVRYYKVTYDTDNNPTGGTSYDTDGTNYTPTVWTPGQLYYVWVRARNTNSELSAYNGYETGYKAMVPPMGLSATWGVYSNQIYLSWTGSTGATGYKIYRNTSAALPGAPLASVSAATNYTDTTATPGTIYYYWVAATNTAVNDSAVSTNFTGYMALTPPSSVAATYDTYADKITVTWNESTGASGYRLFRRQGVNDPSGASDLGGQSSPYDDTGASVGLEYYYWVKATNTAVYDSAFSTSALGRRASQAPPTVINPTATGVGTTTATLGGEISTNGGGAISARGTVWDTSATPTANESTEGGTSTGVFTQARSGLPAGTLIYYRAWASNAYGKAYSTDGSFYTYCTPPTVNAATGVETNKFTANWSASTGATNYFLDVSTAANFASFVSGYSDRMLGNVTTITVTGLVEATTYYYRLRPQNPAGAGGNSSTNSVVTEPSQANTITFSAVGKSAITVGFTGGNGGGAVVVAHEAAAINSSPVDGSTYTANATFGAGTQIGTGNYVVYGGAGSSVTVVGLKTNTTYHFRVYEYSSSGATINYNTNIASGNPASQATLDNEPGIGRGPASYAITTMVGVPPASVGFGVTNIGGSLLSYAVVTNVTWLTQTPVSGTNLTYGSGQQHTISFSITGLVAGVSNATITLNNTGAGQYAATNSGQTITVALTLTNIPEVTAVSAAADGNELVRLLWTATGGRNVMVVHRAGAAPTAPAPGTAYTLGAACGSGKVIYTGTGGKLEHVVTPGATHYYAFYSIENQHYSTGTTVSASMGSYATGEIVEPFACTNGVSVYGYGSGQGWSTTWTMQTGASEVQTNYGNASGPAVPIFLNVPGYPSNTANRLRLNDPGNGQAVRAHRTLAGARSGGQIYVAALVSYQYRGANKWAGISLRDGITEKVFFGKIHDPSLAYSLGVAANSVTVRAPNYDINAYDGEGGNTGYVYLVIGKYDFTTRDATVKGYAPNQPVPGTEPTGAWDATNNIAAGFVSSLDNVLLHGGSTDGGGTIGNLFFDEVRVATNWSELLQLAAPTVTNYMVYGTNSYYVTDSQVTGGTYSVVMHLNSPYGVETTNTAGGFFKPNFDLYNANGLQIASDQVFSAFVRLGAQTVVATNGSHTAAVFDANPLGVYTAAVSFITSNGVSVINSPLLANGSNMIFQVTDDDVAYPVRGTGAGTVNSTDRSLVIQTNGGTLARTAGTLANNARYEITDGALTQVGASKPLTLLFSAYDVGSGLSRGTTDTGSQMHVSIGSWTNNDVAHYYDTGSTNYLGTFNSTAISVWRWTNFSYGDIGTLFTGTTASNPVLATVFDADYDRTGDRLAIYAEPYGSLRVVDDDTAVPYLTTIAFGGLGSKYLVIATNTASDGAVSDRSGSSTGSIYRLLDGYLAGLGAGQKVYFAVGGQDDDSGLVRGTSGTTNTVTTFSIAGLFSGDQSMAYYDASLSDGGDAARPVTNVWTLADNNVITKSMIGSLFSAGTSVVYAMYVDADNDRAGDTLTCYTNVGLLAVLDDDVVGPTNLNFTGNGITLGGATFSNNYLSSGLAITGGVRDVYSGVYAGTSNRYILTRDGAAVSSGTLTPDFADGGALSTTGKLTVTLDAGDVVTVGTYTMRVTTVDYDNDRPGDSLTSTNDFVFTVVIGQYALMGVRGNSTDIADGSSTPNTADGTDFGTNTVSCGDYTEHTFTITNTGNANLALGIVTTSGTHKADFIVTANPASPVASSNGTSFTVRFVPSGLGQRSAAISITNNDATQNPFNFSIQGYGNGKPGLLRSPTNFTAAAAEGGDAASANVGVTNCGGGTLSYSITTNFEAGAADWLSISPATGILASAAGQQHTITYKTADLAMGTYTARLVFTSSGTSCNEATNGPLVSKVVLTVAPGPAISVAPATLVVTSSYGAVSGVAPWPRFFVTNSGGATLYYTNSVTYESGSGWLSFVATSGVANVGAGNTHTAAVDAASLNPGGPYVAYINVNGNQPGAPGQVAVNLYVEGYRAGQVIDLFTNGVTGDMNGTAGGVGWTNKWGSTNFAIVSGSLAVPTGYPAATGNKAQMDTSAGEQRAVRNFTRYTSGRIYVGFAFSQPNRGSDYKTGYLGLSLMDGGAEKAFFGKLMGDTKFGIDAIGTAQVSAFDIYNNTYFAVAMIDLDNQYVRASIFNTSDTLSTEPASWGVSNVCSISGIDGIRLAGKDISSGGSHPCFDEIRVAKTWVELINAVNPEPSADSINMYFTSVTTNRMTVNWGSGDGDSRIVVARKGAAVNWTPTDGSPYSANNDFSAAADQGSGNKVVYSGVGNYFTCSGLTEDTNYYYKVFEFNGTGASADYYTSGSPLSSNRWTLVSEPANHVTNFKVSGTNTVGLDLTWTASAGTPAPDGYVILYKKDAAVTSAPQNGVSYSVGETLGDSLVGKIATPGSAAAGSITNLDTCQTYYMAIFPYRRDTASAQTYNYRTNATVPSATASTICGAPNVQASEIAFNDVGTNYITLSWINGNGAYRIVVAKLGASVDSLPVNGTTYTASSTMGSGSQIGSGNYVVYNGTDTTVNVTGLQIGSNYTFFVFEYNGSGLGISYNTSTATRNPRSSATASFSLVEDRFVWNYWSNCANTNLHGTSTGTGWSDSWSVPGQDFAVFDANFAQFKVYPWDNLDGTAACSANGDRSRQVKVMTGTGGGTARTALRHFPSRTSGKLYIAMKINMWQNPAGSYMGIDLLNGTATTGFFGKAWNGTNTLAVEWGGATRYTPYWTNRTYNIGTGTGNDYLMVGMYDFDRDYLAVKMFTTNVLQTEDPDLVDSWDVAMSNVVVDTINGIKIGGQNVGDLFLDHIRVGANWDEVILGQTVGYTMSGPTPELIYIGTNYVPALFKDQMITNLTDAELVSADKVDFAVRWTDSKGIFLTNITKSMSGSNLWNFGSPSGRVNPNWDPLAEGAATNQFGLDQYFTNAIGANGALVVTTYQYSGFSITNIDFSTRYFVTVSAESAPAGAPTVPAPNSADAVPTNRTLTINSSLRFYVYDDDTNVPLAQSLVVLTNNGSTVDSPAAYQDVGGGLLRYYVSDGALTSVGMRVSFKTYDVYSGILRANTGPVESNMNVAIDTLTTNNYQNFTVGMSMADTTNTASTSTWIFASSTFTFNRVSAMWGGDGSSAQGLDRAIQATIPDSDADRPHDDATASNALFGYVRVIDDDTLAPHTNNIASPDNAAHRLMHISLGNDSLSYSSGGGTNLYYTTTDGALATVAGSSSLVIRVGLRDESSLSRGTSGAATNMSLSVGHAISSNVAAYSAALSTTSATGSNPTNAWSFTTRPSLDELDDLVTNSLDGFTAGMGTNRLTVTAFDGDNDRSNDAASVVNQQFGYFVVRDDDVARPQADNVFTSAVGGGVAAMRVRVGNRLITAGATVNSPLTGGYAWQLTDGDLHNAHLSSTSYIHLVFSAYDVDSGISRGANNGGQSTNMSITWDGVAAANVTNYNDAQSTANSTASSSTNVWTWMTAFETNFIGTLYASGTSNRLVTANIPDSDFDRTTDRLWSNSAYFGLIQIIDDDTVAPTRGNFKAISGGVQYMEITTNSAAVTVVSSNEYAVYRVSDGFLANVSGSEPLRFRFSTYDASGISRATSGTSNSVMNISIGTAITNDMAGFYASESVSDVAATNVWRYTASFGTKTIDNLFSYSVETTTNIMAFTSTNNPITATMPDQDDDRPGDNLVQTNQLFGFLCVYDDDSVPPQPASINAVSNLVGSARPMQVTTNLNDSFWMGDTTNRVYLINDGTLTNLSNLNPLRFSLGVAETSGLSRATSSASTNMSLSLGAVVISNVANYSAAESTPFGTGQGVFTNVWRFASPFSLTQVDNLYNARTTAVTVTMFDRDIDRTSDQTTNINYQYGLLYVVDDDTAGPVVTNLSVGNIGGGVILQDGFDYASPSNGWPSTIPSGTDWVYHADSGVWSAHMTYQNFGTVYAGDRKLGITNGGGWVILPVMDNPGTLYFYTRRTSGGSGGDPKLEVQRDAGGVWVSCGTQTVSSTDYAQFSWSIEHRDVGQTIRVYRADSSTASTYIDSLYLTEFAIWVSTNQAQVSWSPCVTDFSGINEYRNTAADYATTAPTATNDGQTVGLATSLNWNVTGYQGVLTGYVFGVDDDRDRTDDRLKGDNVSFIVRVDTNPPAQLANVQADWGDDPETEIFLHWTAAPNAGNRQHDNAPLSPWKTYRIYYTSNDVGPSLTDPCLTATNLGAPDGLNEMTFTNVVLSNLMFDTTYRLAVAGMDEAGNIGPMSATQTLTLAGLYVTQGLTRVINNVTNAEVYWRAAMVGYDVVRDYDVLVVDNLNFTDSLSNRWDLLVQKRTNVWADSLGNIPTPGSGQMRFFRVANKDRWQTNRVPRAASEEVYVAKRISLYPGRNWIAVPGVPDTNTALRVFGILLPGGSSALDPNATKVSWYTSGSSMQAKKEIWLSASGEWRYSVGGTGNANNQQVPLGEGVLVEYPTGLSPSEFLFIGRVPTNIASCAIKGGMGQDAGAQTFVSFTMPRWVHPTEMNLTNGGYGFKGGIRPGPLNARNQKGSDLLFKWDKVNQRLDANSGIWLNTNDGTWRYTSSGWPVLSESVKYFGPDDALVITSATNTPDWVWTNKLLYTKPSRNMSP